MYLYYLFTECVLINANKKPNKLPLKLISQAL